MKKHFFLLVLMFTAVSYSQQTIPANSRLRITKNAEDTSANKIVVKSDNDELNWIHKDSLKPMIGLDNVDNTSDVNKPVSIAVQASLDTKIDSSLINANNGVAPLDAGGKVPFSNLPASLMIYKGMWTPDTNSPTLADGTGVAGWVYKVTANGSANLGSGSISFLTGDFVIHNGTNWERSVGTDNVVSVNGQQGVVILTTANISDSTNKRYQTDAQHTYNDATSSIQTQLNGKQSILTNPITGTLTTNYIPKPTGINSLGNSQISDDGTVVALSANNAKIIGADSTSRLSVGNSSGTAYIDFYGQSHATIPNDIALITNSTGKIRLFTALNERMRIDEFGNVGIGTSIPSQLLDVNGTIKGASSIFNGFSINNTPPSKGNFANFIQFSNTGGDLYIGQEGSTDGGFFTGSLAYDNVLYSARPINFLVGTASSVYINSNGNVGIGTINPTLGKLQVSHTSNAGSTWGIASVGASGAARDIFMAAQSGFSNGFTVQYTGSEMKYQFLNGRMLVNTNSDDGVNTLQVNGTGKFTDNIMIDAGKYLGFNTTAYMTPEDNVQGARIKTMGGIVLESAAAVKLTNLAGIETRIVTTDPIGNLGTMTNNMPINGTFTPSASGNITFLKSYYTRVGNILTIQLNMQVNITASSMGGTATMTMPNSYTTANITAGRVVGSNVLTYGSNTATGGLLVKEATNTSQLDISFGGTGLVVTNHYCSATIQVEVN